jgi:hypothetical protein
MNKEQESSLLRSLGSEESDYRAEKGQTIVIYARSELFNLESDMAWIFLLHSGKKLRQ